ncbi:MAG: T9SS type A sorting domain-containing protein [Ignavibacteria bacterium]|nr:T9SS type A sorting domain-containing protein [Ignavibacteria bacterium]
MSISVNDSGLFRITYNNAVDFKKTGGITDEYENALLNINCNDPSKPVFSVSLQSDSPLPVTLTSFSSNVIVRDVRLNWVTEKEVNNKGFEVQKKENRKQNTGTYETIGFVESKGNVNSETTYSYFDRNLTSGSYKYRLKQIDYNGNYEYFELNGDVTVGIPNKFDLSQNYPNPFNPVTKINFDIPEDGKINLRIYDMLGREVATLVNDVRTAGYYTVNFDASKLLSGIYLYRLSAGNYNAVKKMALIR